MEAPEQFIDPRRLVTIPGGGGGASARQVHGDLTHVLHGRDALEERVLAVRQPVRHLLGEVQQLLERLELGRQAARVALHVGRLQQQRAPAQVCGGTESVQGYSNYRFQFKIQSNICLSDQ